MISITADGSFHIGDEKFDLAAMKVRLKEIAGGNPLTPIVIKADSLTSYQPVMDLLDLISGAGLTSVGLKNTSGSQAATPAPAVQATNPPKLILAAWLDEVVAGTGSWRGWRADGSLLANHNVDLPDFVPPTTPGLGKTTPGEGEARYVGFWMSDPEVDRWSSAEMTVLDADGKPLDDPATKENIVCAADRDENGKHAGWLLGIFYAGRMGKLPQQVMVRLRYSSGPWWNFGKEIPAEVSTPLVMDENVTVTKTGADARNHGKAFLQWNKPETPGNEQIDFQAVLKDGRTIGWLGISGNHFIFDATPDQVRGFQCRRRGFQTADVTVPMLPGVETKEMQQTRANMAQPYPATAPVVVAPPPSPTPHPQSPQVVVNIRTDGAFMVDGKQVDSALLKMRLMGLAHDDPDQAVILRADKTVDYKYVTAAVDLCRAAGIWNVAFATANQK